MADHDPDDVARKIFRKVEKACPVGKEGEPYNLAAIAGEHFVSDLSDQLGRAYADHAIDFDILIDGQDCEISDVDLDDVKEDDEGGRVVIRAEFENFGEKRVVDLLMVRAGEDWKVADIAYRHRDWQLRRELAGAPAGSK
jgi:hypothetical protein